MTKLVLSVETPKGEVHLEIGQVAEAPAVGDWVDREDSGWRGLVVKRWWFYDKKGRIECRVLLDDGRGNNSGNTSDSSQSDGS